MAKTEGLLMSCEKCKNDLPLLTNYKVVGESSVRQATVKMCPDCLGFFEQQAMSWVGPAELTDQELKEFYPELFDQYR